MEDALSILKEYVSKCYLLGERAIYEDKFEFMITDTDEIVLTKYLTNEETIIIPDFVTALGNMVFEDSKIKSVVANGVKVIGKYCFANSSLEKIEVNNLEIIQFNAFANCTNLKFVIGKNIKVINFLSFANCINLSDIDLFNATSIDKLSFFYCKRLKSVNLSNVVSLDSLSFKDCELETVYINNKCLDNAPLDTKDIFNIVYINDDFLAVVDNLARLYLEKFKSVSKLIIYNSNLTIKKVFVNKSKSQHIRKTQLKKTAKKYNVKI